MAKFKNISGEELLSGPLGNRLIQIGQVIEIPEELAEAYKWTAPFWEPVSETKSKSTSKRDVDTNPED